MSTFLMVAVSKNGSQATLVKYEDDEPIFSIDEGIEVDNDQMHEALDKLKEAIK